MSWRSAVRGADATSPMWLTSRQRGNVAGALRRCDVQPARGPMRPKTAGLRRSYLLEHRRRRRVLLPRLRRRPQLPPPHRPPPLHRPRRAAAAARRGRPGRRMRRLPRPLRHGRPRPPHHHPLLRDAPRRRPHRRPRRPRRRRHLLPPGPRDRRRHGPRGRPRRLHRGPAHRPDRGARRGHRPLRHRHRARTAPRSPSSCTRRWSRSRRIWPPRAASRSCCRARGSPSRTARTARRSARC